MTNNTHDGIHALLYGQIALGKMITLDTLGYPYQIIGMKKQSNPDAFQDVVIGNKEVRTESHAPHREALGHDTHLDQVHGHLGIPAVLFHLIKSVGDYREEPGHSCDDARTRIRLVQ